MKALWNGEIIAQSDETIALENNHYFPPSDIKEEYFVSSEHTSACPWKGTASYYSIKVGESFNENAAWYYASPKKQASHIKGYVAFWKGVQISE